MNTTEFVTRQDLADLEIRMLREMHAMELRIIDRMDAKFNLLVGLILGSYVLNISLAVGIILFVVNHK